MQRLPYTPSITYHQVKGTKIQVIHSSFYQSMNYVAQCKVDIFTLYLHEEDQIHV